MISMMQRVYLFAVLAVAVLAGMAAHPAKAANVYEDPVAPVAADPH